jgi:hypothetical protein
MFTNVSSAERRGYLKEILNYLNDAANGPKEGWKNGMSDARTCLYGLQRPPLNGTYTMIRCDAETTLDDLSPILLPFVITNAWNQVKVSVHPNNSNIINALEEGQVSYVLNQNDEFATLEEQDSDDKWYNVIRVEPMGDKYPLAAQWISLWFPLGHIKSTKSNDQHFLNLFKTNNKWLRVNKVKEYSPPSA